ncbi:MAG TPA: hypothetical protein VFA67_13390 [Candidatus Sulfotelmatobacter sp.]|nr:hypothetical protein [Candidatus Sulfotelmatobacter sp.]
MTILLGAAALHEAVHLSALSNAGVWLHLRTGLWMLHSHSIPRDGLFSQFSSLPWLDSSWGADVLLAIAYRLFGLHSIPLLLMLLKVALGAVTFLLARAGKANFWMAVLLSALGQYVIPLTQFLPYSISIVFFGAELLLLERSRRTGSLRPLYWLPALFVLWANLHALFVSGFMLLLLFLGSIWLEGALHSSGASWLDHQIRPLPLKRIAAVSAACLLAILANPYTFHLFGAAYNTLYPDVAFQYFSEMRAMSFRHPQDYALMLVVMAAFLALGRGRSLRIFESLALITGTLVAFRIQREAWMAVLPAIAVLADGFRFQERGWKSTGETGWRWEKPLIGALVSVILAMAAFRLPHQASFMDGISRNFPVQACDYIRQNRLPQPLFNEYSWGSFLTWYLPEYPVAIDNRVEMYGNEITESYFKVIAGGVRLEANPALAGAQTLLLQKQSGMVKALTTLPALSSQYRLAYSDEVAAVFVRQP